MNIEKQIKLIKSLLKIRLAKKGIKSPNDKWLNDKAIKIFEEERLKNKEIGEM